MNIPYVMKKCNTCGKWLVANNINFYKEKKGKYGLRGQCKECRKIYVDKNKQHTKEYNKKRYEDNREYLLNQAKKRQKENWDDYYKRNKCKILKRKKIWYENNKNKESYKIKRKEYRDNNPHVQFNSNNKRRLREESQGRGITKEQWYEMMMFFDFKCAYSGEYLGNENNKDKRTIDHIVALDNNGENEIWNCIPMKKGYNTSKHTKYMLEWYLEQPFFSIERLTKIYEWRIYAYWKWKEETE